MTITADVTVPARTIPPGPALVSTETSIEFVPHVPLDTGSHQYQYLWVDDSADLDAFEAAVEADVRIAAIIPLDRTASRPFYRVEWGVSPPCPALFRPALVIERARGTPEEWAFRIRTSDPESLQALQRDCRERGVQLGVRRIDHPADATDPDDPHGLTDLQRDVLQCALERGFFEVPRRTTLLEVADVLGISDQAASERLRRAERKLARTALLEDAERG